MVPGNGKVEISFTPAAGGEPIKYVVHEFNNGGGVTMGMFNTDAVSQNTILILVLVSSKMNTISCPKHSRISDGIIH